MPCTSPAAATDGGVTQPRTPLSYAETERLWAQACRDGDSEAEVRLSATLEEMSEAMAAEEDRQADLWEGR